MVALQWQVGPHSPLRREEAHTVQELLDALAGDGLPHAGIADAILVQANNLEAFGALLARYPSPLEEQTLGGRRRGLDTLVEALCTADSAGMALLAPTQAVVGRALSMAQVNFFRLLWHVSTELADPDAAARLRLHTARCLRTGIYVQLVEKVLSDLCTDHGLPRSLRAHAVLNLAQLWGHRLTWRVSESFPLLGATWEARQRVRVVGGTLLGTSELFQLLTAGGDPRFVELLATRAHGEEEVLAFREFLFGRSSEELDRLTAKMAAEGITSIELDSRLSDSRRDAGTILHEFFQARFLQANARRQASLPGPKRTAEGYVVLAWLEQQSRGE